MHVVDAPVEKKRFNDVDKWRIGAVGIVTVVIGILIAMSMAWADLTPGPNEAILDGEGYETSSHGVVHPRIDLDAHYWFVRNDYYLTGGEATVHGWTAQPDRGIPTQPYVRWDYETYPENLNHFGYRGGSEYRDVFWDPAWGALSECSFPGAFSLEGQDVPEFREVSLRANYDDDLMHKYFVSPALTAVRGHIASSTDSGGFEYKVWLSDGTETGWLSNDAVAGNPDSFNKPAVGIAFRLTGEIAEHYDLVYNASIRHYDSPYYEKTGVDGRDDLSEPVTGGWRCPVAAASIPTDVTWNSLWDEPPDKRIYSIVFNIVPKPFTVTYIDQLTGQVIETRDVMYGEDAGDDPAVPSHAGYTCSGWFGDDVTGKDANGNFKQDSYVKGDSYRYVAYVPSPTKTVDKTYAEVDDNVTYTVTENVPNGTDISSLSFTDTLPANFSYNTGSFKVYNGAGADITASAGSLSISSNRLTYSFRDSWIQANSKNVGTLRFVFSGKPTNNAAGTSLSNNASMNVFGTTISSNTVTTEVPVWYLNISKSTDYIDTFDGNVAYSLDGAVFNITGAKVVSGATLTTNTDGWAGTAKIVKSGRYTVTETKPAKGHGLPNPASKTVDLGSGNKGQTITVGVTDPALVYDFKFPIAQKVDSDYYTLYGKDLDYKPESTESRWQGNTPNFSGVKVQIDFYAGSNASGTKLAQAVFASDEQGRIHFSDGTPVDGTTWRYKYGGRNVMPVGIFTLKEIAAPVGYDLDPHVYTGHIVIGSDNQLQLVWD